MVDVRFCYTIVWGFRVDEKSAKIDTRYSLPILITHVDARIRNKRIRIYLFMSIHSFVRGMETIDFQKQEKKKKNRVKSCFYKFENPR